MSTPLKLTLFGALLALALAVGALVGGAVGPIDVGDDDRPHHERSQHAPEAPAATSTTWDPHAGHGHDF